MSDRAVSPRSSCLLAPGSGPLRSSPRRPFSLPKAASTAPGAEPRFRGGPIPHVLSCVPLQYSWACPTPVQMFGSEVRTGTAFHRQRFALWAVLGPRGVGGGVSRKRCEGRDRRGQEVAMERGDLGLARKAGSADGAPRAQPPVTLLGLGFVWKEPPQQPDPPPPPDFLPVVSSRVLPMSYPCLSRVLPGLQAALVWDYS